MNTNGDDLPDEDAMRPALDFLLETAVEARQAAGQYRRTRNQGSPFALREALGMGAAFHPGEALGNADLGMAQNVDAEIAPLANPCMSFPPPIDTYEQLRRLGRYRTNRRGGHSGPALCINSCRNDGDGCRELAHPLPEGFRIDQAIHLVRRCGRIRLISGPGLTLWQLIAIY